MRLDFNILWIEDQAGRVSAQRTRIALQLRKEGFRLQVEFANSMEKALPFLSSSIYGDHIDLVLIDYDLGPGVKGDQGLVEIRKKLAFKDIVFYSSQAADLLKMVSKQQVQGVFCSTRQDLPRTVVGVFKALVKKVVDIDHSRGIVMGATSEIDYHVNQGLMNAFARIPAPAQTKIIQEVLKHLKAIRKRFEDGAKKIESIAHLQELEPLHHIYTSNDRVALLRKLLAHFGELKTVDDKLKDYITTTVPDRNKLAHLRVQRDGFSRKLIDREGNELTLEKMRSLRVALLESQEKLEELSEYFSRLERDLGK